MKYLNKRPHSVTTSCKLFFPIRRNAVSRQDHLCPNCTEEQKNGFGIFMMGPSSKDYENHVLFEKLRYNIPKIFETMLEMHQDKGNWDKTRESCLLHLGFSGSTTNQQSEMLTKVIDATAITAKPEMNGKQDCSLDEFFHRMMGPIHSLLSNTALVYLSPKDGGPPVSMNHPNLEEEEFAKVVGERCGCPTETDDDMKNLFHALSVVLQEVGDLITEDRQELDMEDEDIDIDFV
jgi:hypothetical protein